jgi:nucleoside-diphosphate kinase
MYALHTETRMEHTLVVLKPDAVQRGLIGTIIGRFEAKGFKIVAMKMVQVTRAQAEKMYAEHKGKDFYEPLVEFITACPVVAAVLEGKDAISMVRRMMGPTFGPDAPAGTIRGDFGCSRRYNLVHGSDSPESARREIDVFFKDEELAQYELGMSSWIYARHLGDLI